MFYNVVSVSVTLQIEGPLSGCAQNHLDALDLHGGAVPLSVLVNNSGVTTAEQNFTESIATLYATPRLVIVKTSFILHRYKTKAARVFARQS